MALFAITYSITRPNGCAPWVSDAAWQEEDENDLFSGGHGASEATMDKSDSDGGGALATDKAGGSRAAHVCFHQEVLAIAGCGLPGAADVENL